MKPYITVLGIALAALPAAAQAVERNFAGLEIGTFSQEVSRESGGTLSTDEDASYVGLKVGRLSSAWRAYATFHVPDLDNEDNVWWLTASYDYLFNQGSTLQPFLGGHFGYYDYSADNSDLSINAITVGPEVGVQLLVDPFLAELGYRAGFGVNSSDNSNARDFELDYAQTVFVGVSMTF
jgi:hypothetical protein